MSFDYTLNYNYVGTFSFFQFQHYCNNNYKAPKFTKMGKKNRVLLQGTNVIKESFSHNNKTIKTDTDYFILEKL